jgi:aspartate 1-decarboxylase
MSLIVLLRTKLHRAVVTNADLDYEGSISIDISLMEAVGLREDERVDVLNITNGARFTTYTIAAPRDSRTIGVNGAAARLVQPGDRVIVISYQYIDENAPAAPARVALLDENNKIRSLR